MRVQERGHCPVCGRLQAVGNHIAIHGYTVDDGWYKGRCPGSGFLPMELSRERTERALASLESEAKSFDDAATQLHRSIVKYGTTGIEAFGSRCHRGGVELRVLMRHGKTLYGRRYAAAIAFYPETGEFAGKAWCDVAGGRLAAGMHLLDVLGLAILGPDDPCPSEAMLMRARAERDARKEAERLR